VQAGKLRALAVLGPKRAAAMPEVPTAAESGMPWFDVQTWYGTLAPAGTPQNITRYLNAEFVKIVNAPDVRQHLEGMGAEPLTSTPEEFAEFIKLEAQRWARVVKDSGAQVE
jgi:tripartite-type tricarboxylate transporter receptor subunit TctC